MNTLLFLRLSKLSTAGLLLMLAAGCAALRATTAPPPSFYSLDSVLISTPTVATSSPLTLIINPPDAAAGFDTPRIIYIREPYKLEYYAHNEWIDTPPRMLAPLIVASVVKSGTFRAVVLTPSAAAGDLRLDTEIIRLQHEFGTEPSRVHFTLRAYIVDNLTRRVLGWKEFDQIVPVTSEGPYGGVVAANRAVQTVLEQLASFCTEAAINYSSAADDREHTEGSALKQ